MYAASELFKRAISQPNRDLSIKCTIDNQIYTDTDIQDCSIEESILTGETFKLGSATASNFTLTLLNMDDSLTAKSFEGKEVHIEIGIVLDKFSQPVEYVSMGYFIVEKGTKEKNNIKLSGYDKMIFFEKPYTSSLSYPATLKQILEEVCNLAGVPLENKPFLNQGYLIQSLPDLENVTLRNVLEYVSELACGFACINRNGKVEIFTFAETDITIDGDNFYEMRVEEFDFKPINRVVIKSEETTKSFGEGTNTIEIVDNMLATSPSDELIENIYNAIANFEFKPFTTTWQGNVLTAPADLIKISEKDNIIHKSFIANQKFNYSTGLKCDITTGAKTTLQTEYQTKGTITKELAKNKSKIEKTDERITLEVERVDESIAALRIEADNISLSVQTLDSRMGTAEAQILIQSGEISQRVSYTDYNGQTIGSLINQTPYAIDIEAGKLNLKGYATFSSLSVPGATTIDGSNISTGSMSADAIFGGTLKFSNFSSLYEENHGYNTLVFSSGGYKFEQGGTIDFSNNPVIGLNVYASFG